MLDHPGFTLALALAAGILAQATARHLRVPGIVLLLAAGAGLGPDGLGWVHPQALGDGLIATVELAVALILFEGGLNLEISRLRREQSAIRRLVTWGALITLAGGALAAWGVFGWPPMRSLLFGSLVVVTGPTVIGPLVRELRLRPRVGTVLEAEGVLIDPVGAILAVLLLELAIAPDAESRLGGAAQFLLQIGFGAGAGAAAGYAISRMLRVRHLIPEGFENIAVLASVLLLFQACDVLVHESGILAVTVAGVVVGNLRSRVDRDLREFKDQLSVLMIGLLFVLLAADVRIAEMRALGWQGVAVVALLVVVVRPLGVWFCTLGSDLTLRERVFVGWIAPRGIVAAAVASVTANALDAAGDPGGSQLRALVFLTIAGTVVLAGGSAPLVASLLRVRLPSRETVAILGAAQGLSLALGAWLRDVGRPVVFLDSSPANARQAQEAGFPVVFGDALQERTLQRARFEGVGAAVGLTPNQVLNSVFTGRARERFDVPDGYIAVLQKGAGLAPEIVESQDAWVLFDGPHDVERWEVRDRHGDVAQEDWEVVREREKPKAKDGEEAPQPAPPSGEHLVILGVLRGSRALLMREGLELAVGDRVRVAIYEPEREAAERHLRWRGMEPAAEEAPPEDEDEAGSEAAAGA